MERAHVKPAVDRAKLQTHSSNGNDANSESSVPSSPTRHAHPLFSFSDPQAPPSSPPSSPPTFPWEQTAPSENASTSPIKPAKTAFSILGKRKPLQSAGENARPAKKPATSSSQTLLAKAEPMTLTQMHISLGQQVQRKCQTCGMEYIASSNEDRKLHDKYHAQNTQGYDVGRDFLAKARDRTLFKIAPAADTIAAVDAFDDAWRKKRARAALDVVQRELGAVEIQEERLWEQFTEHLGFCTCVSPFTTYMYIRGTKCIGLLLVQQITEARRVAKSAAPSGAKADATRPKSSGTALEALRARHVSSVATDCETTYPLELSNETVSAVLGISRVWTSPLHRNQGIATSLLDTALTHHNQRVRMTNAANRKETGLPMSTALRATLDGLKKDMVEIAKEDVAFSQPTEQGARLASKWFGKGSGWKLYVD